MPLDAMVTYKIETLHEIQKMLENATPQEPRYLTYETMLERLTPQIRALYTKKNYEPRQIVALLKDSGFNVKLKDVKAVLHDVLRPAVRPR